MDDAHEIAACTVGAGSALRAASTVRWAAAFLGAALRVATPFALIAAFASAHAQYFGRNKVLWEQFEFAVLETEHFSIHYYPPEAEHGEYVARLAERWYTRLSRFFDHELSEKTPLIVYSDHADFQQTLVTPGLIGEGTGGFTESLASRVVLPLTGINADNDHVIGHELVHVFQFDLIDSLRRAPQEAQPQALPLWAIEGLAEYLSQGRRDPTTALWMRDAVAHERLPDPDAFIQEQLSPYQYGQAVWAYVGGRWGDIAVRRLFASALSVGLDEAFERVLGLTKDQFWELFHSELREFYLPFVMSRPTASTIARPLLTRASTGAGINLAPALSPDGSLIAFLSSRELEVELYLADARTGEVLEKLVTAEADPHFQSLSFIDASVAWSPDGRRFAFAVFAEGERQLAIYDVDNGRVERRIALPGVGGARHPAWAPDGRSIVFSAVSGRASDLYRVDLENGDITQLTADAYTAIQPTVSPDGRTVVFATDRGQETNLNALEFGALRLAALDIATGAIEVLPIPIQGKQMDPEFALDGTNLFFIAEHDGIPDVFRYDLRSGEVSRVTQLETGVSGITGVSPALSVSASGIAAFSTLQDHDWGIYTLDTARVDMPVEIGPTTFAGALPPVDARGAPNIVMAYLAQPEFGLPPTGRRYPAHPYEGDFGLESIGPVSVGVGTFSTGTDFAGSFGMYFNDRLNRHQLVTTLSGGSTQGALDFMDTIGAGATYLNQTRRFQWGASASRIPYLSSVTFLSTDTVPIDGSNVPADIVERVIEAMHVTELSVIGQYPFSLNNRLETTLGSTRIGFERQLERYVFPQGFPGSLETIDLPSPESLDLNQAAVAFVRDTSRFGFVSPVRGTRFRLESRWTTGDLDFRTTLIDYRRYFFRRPLTFAFRALHVGRRGDAAEDPRLSPLDIGNNSLVRGYEIGSFDPSECTPVPDSDRCPEFDRLVGSRIAVLNFELRLALLGTEDFGIFDVPALPTELLFFVDAGAAWSSGQSVDVTFNRDTLERVPVVSAGIGARSLLLGALPIEVFYAYPFQRPEENAVFGFRIGVAW